MELNQQVVAAHQGPPPTPMQQLLRPVLWVGTFSVLLRQLMHMALPPLPSLAWELWLSTSLTATWYLQSVDSREPLWMSALHAQLYAAPVVLLQMLMFPAAQEGFWISLWVVPLGVLIASALEQWWSAMQPTLFGQWRAANYNGQSRYPPGGTVQQFSAPTTSVIVTPDEAGLLG